TTGSGRCSSSTYIGPGGGSGGNGGGIVEIYAGTFSNAGTIDVSGAPGGPPYNDGVRFGGGGTGGSGGSVILGYGALASTGTINYAGGTSATGGDTCTSNPSGCGTFGPYVCGGNVCSTSYCFYGGQGGANGGSCGSLTYQSTDNNGCNAFGGGNSGAVYLRSGWHP
ncbi:MAG: hypothetical protein KGH78_03690, partial [Candidatus Micrarchaeota archaeon]|nr:hypothetical protein [Candidatus Micrarchaeota archaeon]